MALNAQEIIRETKKLGRELGLGPDPIVVGFGAALVMRDKLKTETNDIDAYITKDSWDKLIAEGYDITRYENPDIQVIKIRDFELAIYPDPKWIGCWDRIGGIPVTNLELMLEGYTILNRPKDQPVLELLREDVRFLRKIERYKDLHKQVSRRF